MRGVLLGASLVLASMHAPCVAAAKDPAVQVRFIGDPALYADFGDSKWDRESNTLELTTLFTDLANQLPAGQSLQIEVLDVNLAGEPEWSRGAKRIRVMRDIGWPMLELRFTLSQDGLVLKQGQERLTDMAYLSQSQRTSAWQALPYERRMVIRWLNDKVLTPEAKRVH